MATKTSYREMTESDQRDAILGEVHRTVETLLESATFRPGHDDPLDLEQVVQEAMRTAGDAITAYHLRRAHRDKAYVKQTVQAAYDEAQERGERLRNQGWRPVPVQFQGGSQHVIWTPYLRRDLRGRRGRRRGTGRRGPDGTGTYPVLVALGVESRCSALTRSDIALHTILCSSYEEARTLLARRGIRLDIDTLTAIAVEIGQQSMDLKDAALEMARQMPVPEGGLLAGQRVRVSVDGGRTRTRTTNPRSRKGKNGRRKFTTAWREPRILTIDILDDEGGSDPQWRPIYDVTLGNADETFALLIGHLRWLGAAYADDVLFVADGAEWIWNRVEAMRDAAEIPPERFHLALDYYHAAEHITEILDLCKGMTAAQRKQEIRRLSRLLRDAPDGAAQVVEDLRARAIGRRARKIKEKLAYFESHLPHMQYASLRARKLPIGSGIVESAVRRVINLRFKGASIFWKVEHLEPLLFLRAVWKSGWWEDMCRGLIRNTYFLEFQFPQAWDSAA